MRNPCNLTTLCRDLGYDSVRFLEPKLFPRVLLAPLLTCSLVEFFLPSISRCLVHVLTLSCMIVVALLAFSSQSEVGRCVVCVGWNGAFFPLPRTVACDTRSPYSIGVALRDCEQSHRAVASSVLVCEGRGRERLTCVCCATLGQPTCGFVVAPRALSVLGNPPPRRRVRFWPSRPPSLARVTSGHTREVRGAWDCFPSVGHRSLLGLLVGHSPYNCFVARQGGLTRRVPRPCPGRSVLPLDCAALERLPETPRPERSRSFPLRFGLCWRRPLLRCSSLLRGLPCGFVSVAVWLLRLFVCPVVSCLSQGRLCVCLGALLVWEVLGWSSCAAELTPPS